MKLNIEKESFSIFRILHFKVFLIFEIVSKITLDTFQLFCINLDSTSGYVKICISNLKEGEKLTCTSHLYTEKKIIIITK